MARFYAEIQGNRGITSRMGSADSGMWGHIRGWNIGAKIRCYVDKDGIDHVAVYLTGGSNGNCSERLIADLTSSDKSKP